MEVESLRPGRYPVAPTPVDRQRPVDKVLERQSTRRSMTRENGTVGVRQ